MYNTITEGLQRMSQQKATYITAQHLQSCKLSRDHSCTAIGDLQQAADGTV